MDQNNQTPKTIAMKNKDHVSIFSMKGKLLQLVMIIALMLPVSILQSQESSTRSTAVYPTFGFGIGFFYPSDVNDYIQYEIDDLGYTDQYNTSLYMYLEIKGGLTFRMKKMDISGSLEYCIAPKWVVVTGGGSNLTYSYTRLSPVITANYYIPLKSGRHAFFLGGGVHYNIMKFKKFSASSPGFKLQAGFSLQMGKFNLQPYVAFNYVKATDSSDQVWGDFDMDYTGGQIGIMLSFHPRINYK
jgi:hypothetical protein